jgi:hypothetical protein
MWVISSLVLVHLVTVLVSMQDRCTVCAKFRNHFVRTRWNSKVTRLMWNLVLVRLETVLVSEQDRSMICGKRTIGSKISLDAPIGTPR